MKLLVAAGASVEDLCDYGKTAGLWYYRCQSTCVGTGGSTASCPASGDPSDSVYCAGGDTFGWGAEQAAAVVDAVSNGGVHASCPVSSSPLQPPPSFPPSPPPSPQHSPLSSGRHTLSAREFEVFVPDGVSSASPAPVLIVLHGNGGQGNVDPWRLGIPELGHILVAPDGPSRSWNIKGEDSKEDDAYYVRAGPRKAVLRVRRSFGGECSVFGLGAGGRREPLRASLLTVGVPTMAGRDDAHRAPLHV